MKTFYDRLMSAAAHYGVHKASHVAKKIGRSPAAVAQWKDNPNVDHKATTISSITKIFPCDTEWLVSGKGEPQFLDSFSTALKVRTERIGDMLETLVKPSGVPVISWVKAGNFDEINDPYAPGESDTWVPVYNSRKVSSNTFALTVDGNSMQCSGPISFNPGDILICDPEKGADAGDFVIAKDVSTQEATFKKLGYDAGRWYLVPLNDQYKAIPIDKESLRIIAKVVQKISVVDF
jgi:SOS-response transcriptional repressor LexA